MITASLPKPAPAGQSPIPVNPSRIHSIDFLRGLAMVIMALDHVRDYFHADLHLHGPMDMQTTTPALFFTRWITHFCAPTFVFLSGISAFKAGEHGRSRPQLSLFLLSRGLWLIFLEITLVTFGWTFDIHYRMLVLQVIWAIGVSMIVLAGLVYLPRTAILATGILLVAGHNLLDPVHVTAPPLNYVWSALHEFAILRISREFTVFLVYPVLPWVGLMALGYCTGILYRKDFREDLRRKILVALGTSCIVLFLVLRFLSAYGDGQTFEEYPAFSHSVYDFLNTTKYPPSLHFLLMTIGPVLLLLAFTENFRNKVATVLVTIGRVPLFYYVLHLYLIHALAVTTALISGYSWREFGFGPGIGSFPAGYGFDLGTVYVFWLLVLLLLYPLCKRFARYKALHKNNRFLSYL
jgi:uncharacterized membrane protein